MTSKIDPGSINPSYPVSSANQSSQGFRDNFKAIQNGLKQAKTENTLILGTTFSVSGNGIDSFNSTSIELGNGVVPLQINLSSQSSVTPGTYDLSSDLFTLTVNDRGVISSMAKSAPLPTVDTSKLWSVTRTPADTNFPNQSGITSFTYPTFVTNESGRVVSSGTNTISNLGLLGYSQPKGSIISGSNSNLSTFLTVGQDAQVLTADSTSATGLSWKTPTVGTVTEINTGPGLKSNGSNSTPEIDLNIDALPNNGTFDTGLEFLSYDNGTHYKTSWTNMVLSLENTLSTAGFIKGLDTDVNPTLGANLNTNNFNIGSPSWAGLGISSGVGGLNLTSSGNGSFVTQGSLNLSSPTLQVNGLTFPNNLPSSDNMVLCANKNGKLYWQQASASVSTITGDNAITPVAIGSTTSISFTPWNLDAGALTNTDMVLMVDKVNGKSNLVPASQVSGTAMASGIVFVANDGDDLHGSGSMVSPYQTIDAAYQNYPSYEIVLMPGSYNCKAPSFTGIVIVSFIPKSAIIQSNTTFSQSTIGGVQFAGQGTFDGSTLRNCDIRGNSITANSTVIEDSGIYASITNTGKLSIDKCTNSLGMYNTITSSGSLTITSSSYFAITHNSGTCYIDSVQFLGNITSTPSGTEDVLSIRNSSLSTNIKEVASSGKNKDGTPKTGMSRIEWYTIQKTGTCPYIIQNVSRMPSRDTLNGTRLEFASTDKDQGIAKKVDIISGSSYTIDNSTRFYDLTVNTIGNVSINIPSDSFDDSKWTETIKVMLRGTSTSAGTITLNFPGVQWETGTAPRWNGSNNSTIIFTFTWVSGGGFWYGSSFGALSGVGGPPPGTPYPWPSTVIPQGWLLMDGSTFNTSLYPQLASVYTSGKLPDLRGMFIRGLDTTGNVDRDGQTRGLLSFQEGTRDAFDIPGHAAPMSFFQDSQKTNTNSSVGIDPVSNASEVHNVSWAAGGYGGVNYVTVPSLNSNQLDQIGIMRPKNVAFNYIVRAA